MTLTLLCGIALSLMMIVSAFTSWVILLKGKFRTCFIMPQHESDPPSKGKKWFIVQSLGLFLAGGIVVLRTMQIMDGHRDNVMENLFYAISGFLLVRVVGEFKVMGLFRTVKDTEFARIDHRVLTPMAYIMFLLSLVLL